MRNVTENNKYSTVCILEADIDKVNCCQNKSKTWKSEKIDGIAGGSEIMRIAQI